MLKHIVMWKFKEDVDGCSPQDHARWMKEHLEALVGVIPEIRFLEVGVDTNHGEMAYDAVLISVFDDAEAMERYKKHPAHQAVSTYCKKVRLSRTVVDYEF